MLEGNIDPVVLCIVIFNVTLTEGSAPAILPAQPHRRAFQDQAGERERLGQGPIDIPPRYRLAALLDKASQFRVQMEIRGKGCDPRGNTIDEFASDGRR